MSRFLNKLVPYIVEYIYIHTNFEKHTSLPRNLNITNPYSTGHGEISNKFKPKHQLTPNKILNITPVNVTTTISFSLPLTASQDKLECSSLASFSG
jgi:hypothetical protein